MKFINLFCYYLTSFLDVKDHKENIFYNFAQGFVAGALMSYGN